MVIFPKKVIFFGMNTTKTTFLSDFWQKSGLGPLGLRLIFDHEVIEVFSKGQIQ